jgi:hypothetical protein
MYRNRRIPIVEPPHTMVTTARTLVLQRLLQKTTGGNATDQRGIGPAPADYGPALRTAYATGYFLFCSRGPPSKAFRKTLPDPVKKNPLICELTLDFTVPSAHHDCYFMLELVILEFNRQAQLYFGGLNVYSSDQECVFKHRIVADDINTMMQRHGRGLRAITNGP